MRVSAPQMQGRLRFYLLIALTLAVAACAAPPPEAPPPPPPPPPPTTAPAARAPVPKDWRPYVVRRGDTLGRIARCHGVGVERLAEANELADPDRLAAGATLRVPPRNRCAARAAPAPANEARPRRADEPSRARARQLLDGARARYDGADFEAALAEADAAARALDPTARDAATDALAARCHLLAAMAAIGLERRERALAELRRAFALDPGLEIPPEDASPRLQELVSVARPDGPADGRE